jgi:hypothetical protein
MSGTCPKSWEGGTKDEDADFEGSTFQVRRTACYALQTKILEGGTKDEILIFDILFKVSSPKSSTRTLEQWFENPDFIFCSSLQNLRFGWIEFAHFVLLIIPT